MYGFISTVRQFQGDPNTFNSFSCRTEYFQNYFFPSVIGEWNKLNPETHSCGNYNLLQKPLLNFIRPNASKVYNANYTISITLKPDMGTQTLT